MHEKLILGKNNKNRKRTHLKPEAFFPPQNQSIEHILNRFSIIIADEILGLKQLHEHLNLDFSEVFSARKTAFYIHKKFASTLWLAAFDGVY